MNKFILVLIIVAIAAISAVFASPLFYNTEINEPMPVNLNQERTIISKSYEGIFEGANDGIHNAEGKARVVLLDDDKQILRLENFRSTNGPDLHVYLSSDYSAKEIVDLGQLKANMGNQNYEIPENTDLDKYNKVLIWCKPFSVLFGKAILSDTP